MHIFTQKLAFLLLFIVAINFQSNAQGIESPYELKWEQEAPLLGASAGLLSFNTFYWAKKLEPLTITQIEALDRADVWKFDRSATYNWSPSAAKASDYLLYGSPLVPSLLLLDKDIRQDWDKALIITAETYLINAALTTFTKNLSKRSRPYTYNPDAPLAKKLEKDARHSFYSGHTSVAASSWFMMAQLYNDYHPDSKLTPWMWGVSATVPAIMGYLRYRGGKHYPSDVIIGYLAGAAVGILVPRLHKIGPN